MHQQLAIGWHQLLKGFLSLPWTRLASRKPLDDDTQDLKRGTQRIHVTLQALHTFTRVIWMARNDMLHKHAETSVSLKYSAESAEIRHYFADPLLFPAKDRHYVSDSLNKLLRSRPSVRRRWLRRVRSARASMIKHGTSQITIKTFFTRIQRQERATQPRSPTPVSLQETTTVDSITAPPLPQQTQERTQGRPPDTTILTRPVHRTNTTQQRMTEFFPGRPRIFSEEFLPSKWLFLREFWYVFYAT
jgi:hypothetical protein